MPCVAAICAIAHMRVQGCMIVSRVCRQERLLIGMTVKALALPGVLETACRVHGAHGPQLLHHKQCCCRMLLQVGFR
jgi:hypothetical protein